ncbi:hypothetical protein [Paraburkholderia sp. RL17-347-BIC-D]|jgi:hypothetical protein
MRAWSLESGLDWLKNKTRKRRAATTATKRMEADAMKKDTAGIA